MMTKIRKTIFSVLAAAAAAMLLAVNVCAASEGFGATYCFDKNTSLSQWESYGSVEETGFTYKIDTSVKEQGDGSLCIAENFTKAVPSDKRSGGIYITADKLGLENFAGCTVQASYMFDGAASAASDTLTMYSEGAVWIQSTVPVGKNGRWSSIALSVPADAKNDRIGFTIPIYEPYNGKVVYIDNLIIYDANGKAIPNTGDYCVTEAGIIVSLSTPVRIILIGVVLIILVAVIFGIKFIVKNFNQKFI